ncbi:MAG TPA: hypothetical protein VGM51_14565 [Armatimonadota bacterium]|jgi:hypothetical protein
MKPSKAADFFIGLVGIYLTGALMAILMPAVGFGDEVLPVGIVVAIGLCIWAVARQRPYIVLGMVMSIVFPALAFGACTLLLSGVQW